MAETTTSTDDCDNKDWFKFKINYICVIHELDKDALNDGKAVDNGDYDELSVIIFACCIAFLMLGVYILAYSFSKLKKIVLPRIHIMHEETYCIFTKLILQSVQFLLVCHSLDLCFESFGYIIGPDY